MFAHNPQLHQLMSHHQKGGKHDLSFLATLPHISMPPVLLDSRASLLTSLYLLVCFVLFVFVVNCGQYALIMLSFQSRCQLFSKPSHNRICTHRNTILTLTIIMRLLTDYYKTFLLHLNSFQQSSKYRAVDVLKYYCIEEYTLKYTFSNEISGSKVAFSILLMCCG